MYIESSYLWIFLRRISESNVLNQWVSLGHQSPWWIYVAQGALSMWTKIFSILWIGRESDSVALLFDFWVPMTFFLRQEYLSNTFTIHIPHRVFQVFLTNCPPHSTLTFCRESKMLKDISPFVGPPIPMFLTSDDICSGFQSQSGQPYLHLAKVYMLHVPWHSPLVWHLPTCWWPAWQHANLFPWPGIGGLGQETYHTTGRCSTDWATFECWNWTRDIVEWWQGSTHKCFSSSRSSCLNVETEPII